MAESIPAIDARFHVWQIWWGHKMRFGRPVGAVTALAALATIAEAAIATASEAHVGPTFLEPFLIVAANLLLIPTALYLGAWLWREGPVVAAGATLAGVISLVLWACAPVLGLWSIEALWIGLSAIWWLGVGRLLRRRKPRLAIFTSILGVAAGLDAIVTASPRASFLILASAGAWKLPLSLIWIIWLALALLRPAAKIQGADGLSTSTARSQDG